MGVTVRSQKKQFRLVRHMVKCPFGCGWEGSSEEYSKHYEICLARKASGNTKLVTDDWLKLVFLKEIIPDIIYHEEWLANTYALCAKKLGEINLFQESAELTSGHIEATQRIRKIRELWGKLQQRSTL